MKVIGLDPSLSNFGIVNAELDINFGLFAVTDMKLVETKPTTHKSTRKNNDDLSRASEIYDALKPALQGVSMAFVEVPHGSQSARAMASYGICIGLLASIEVPMIQLSEQQLKIATLGKKTGTKQEAIDWAVSQHPEAPWLSKGGKILGKNEHLADATAAIEAGLRSQDYLNAIAILKFAA